MKNLKRILPIAILGITIALTTVACKKESIEPNDSNDQTASSFKVRMTDAPGDFAALDVEITKVEAYLQNEGWVTLNNQSQVVSILDLTNGAETTIAQQSAVSAGLYTRVRLTFGSNNSLSLTDSILGSTINANLILGSSQQVEILIDEQVSAGTNASVLLDFQVAQSIFEQSQEYILDPAVTLIEDESTGVQGQVEGAATAMIILSDGENEFSTFINAQGKFLIRGVEDGVYDLIIEAGNEATESTILSGVVIVQGQITQMGTIEL